MEDEPSDPSPPETSFLDEIQARCDALTDADEVDKKIALSVLKLHHAMEKQLVRLCRDKDNEIEKLRRELMIEKLSHSRSETLETLVNTCQRQSVEISTLSGQVNELKAASRRLDDSYTQCASSVNALEGRLPLKKR